jgi:glycosyltransferase involved in cell wall biosynthesis
MSETNSKTNILFTSEYGSLSGGGQQSILLLLRKLPSTKFTCFLNAPEEGSLIEEAKKCDVKTALYHLPPVRLRNTFKVIGILLSLKKFIKTNHIHIIHTESARATFYYGFAAKQLKVPLIYHVRVSMPEPKYYEKLLYNMATHIIAVSKSAAQRFDGFKNESKKITIIYNAIDPNTFNTTSHNNDFRNEFDIKDDLLVGMVGQLTPFKGQNDFLIAASKVVPQMKNIKFILIGSDTNNYRSQLEKSVNKLDLHDHVIISDYRSDISKVMSNLDILVNASKYEGKFGGEGFSRVIIEAMALEKPVIATQVGGNIEAIEDNVTGILVEPNNPESLANAINHLSKNKKKRMTMGLAGKERVLNNFTVETQITHIENCYSEVLNLC